LPPNEILNAEFVSKLPAKATPSVRHFWARQLPPISVRRHVLHF
jgi:hypothetical protein